MRNQPTLPGAPTSEWIECLRKEHELLFAENGFAPYAGPEQLQNINNAVQYGYAMVLCVFAEEMERLNSLSIHPHESRKI